MGPGGYLRNGVVREPSLQGADGGVKMPGWHQMAGFPDGGAGMPGPDFPGIRPSVQTQHARGQSGGDMHGTAVHGDHAMTPADQPDEFPQGGLIEKVLRIGRKRGREGLEALSYQQDWQWSQSLAEQEHLGRGQGFAGAATERMQ